MTQLESDDLKAEITDAERTLYQSRLLALLASLDRIDAELRAFRADKKAERETVLGELADVRQVLTTGRKL